MAQARFPNALSLLITADGGGSNGYRVRLWKAELHKLADELHLPISACHFPPGTSKWNQIEHRLFSFITQNWRGKPLVSHQVIVNLIASTTTGLKVQSRVDERHYPKDAACQTKNSPKSILRPTSSTANATTPFDPRRNDQRIHFYSAKP